MIHKSEIFKNKSYWENMTPIQLENFKNKIFQYYRMTGFPYHQTDKLYRDKEFKKLLTYDRTNLIEDGVIKQTMHGLGFLWSYFPHAYDVKCNNKMTPYEVFNDDNNFMKVIEKRLKIGTYISDSGIMKMLKMYSNTQAVSNFRPTAAAAIYDKYAPNGVVWDMSGGWGGRMLGAIASGVNTYYVTEPSKKTFIGLTELASDYCYNTKINLSMMGSEDYSPIKNSLDLCFTSPPYFDLEKYADEETQNYKKYSTKDDWVNGFLHNTIINCHNGLKKNKHMLINIADPKKKNDLNIESETIRIAKLVGFEHVETLKLTLSNPNMRNRTSPFKYEPIFVFKKI